MINESVLILMPLSLNEFQINIKSMFLFKCCQQFSSGIGYQVHRKPDKIDFLSSSKEIDNQQFLNQQIKIVKIKKSQYQEVFYEYNKAKKKFIDQEFPANELSLGEIQGLSNVSWKRIPEIINNPILIGDHIEPCKVIQGKLGDCYFLSAIAALAQKQERIKTIFKAQSYNNTGIYKVTLRINGQLQEVVVDDFIPVTQNGLPIFCQPYRNQIWLLILEKAWAKIHGSYSNIIMGTQTAVFRAITLAPSDLLIIKNKNQDKEHLWSTLVQYTSSGYPLVCTTKEDVQKDSKLAPGISFTLVQTALLEDFQGVFHKMLKFRDPWCRGVFQGGPGSQQDRNFWNRIVTGQQRKIFQKKPQNGVQGIIYMTYIDFCSYFSQLHYCLIGKQASYNSEPLFINKKNGRLFQVKVQRKGNYCFELHQSEIEELNQQEKKSQGLCRSTMVLIKKNQQGYEFVNGALKYNQEDAILNQTLEAGNYILYAKIDPTRSKRLIPKKTSISLYSPCFTLLQNVEKNRHPDLLKKVFLNHARGYKKNKYNNGLMWISWKLLLQQGGYAYVAMGVDSQSNKKFVIDFNEQDFNKMNFKLKGQFKGKGRQKLQVLPGQEKIILARVVNQLVKTLKFPPSLGIKMELISGH